MSFYTVAILTSIAGLGLGMGWVFAGKRLFSRWDIPSHPDGILVGRRLGAVYLSIALLLFLGREAPHSELRDALCTGMLFGMIALACLGTMEYRAGRVNALMLISVVLEIVLALGYASVLLQ